MSQSSVQQFLDTAAGKGVWTLDPKASSVELATRTMWGLVNVKGTFERVSGQGRVGPGGAISGMLTIDAASISTGHAKRDKHLRGADFFDVERYPEFTIRVVGGTPRGTGVEFRTEFTIKGVTRSIPLTGTVDQLAGDAVTVSVETHIDRARFGMDWNQMGMIKGRTTVAVRAVFKP
ncbi:YceI family protein [Streptomyces sp. NPDC058691]|uniref:YceI family protein n=1 Tax=Streptomyces sp. NPDC058691 TaxID=3346601 RepID=UPI003659E515